MVAKRSIVLSLILSFVTCGLYIVYWQIKLTDEMSKLLGDKNATSGLMTIIFELLTCGIYGFYWAYKMGERVERLKGVPSGSTGLLYLIVFIFGYGLVNLALIQDAINDKLNGAY